MILKYIYNLYREMKKKKKKMYYKWNLIFIHLIDSEDYEKFFGMISFF